MFREQVEAFEYETEWVALRIIQTAVGAWCARRASELWPDKHPCGNHSSWWKEHPIIYPTALRAARSCRLRTLKLLKQLVRRQQPLSMVVEKGSSVNKLTEKNLWPIMFDSEPVSAGLVPRTDNRMGLVNAVLGMQRSVESDAHTMNNPLSVSEAIGTMTPQSVFELLDLDDSGSLGKEAIRRATDVLERVLGTHVSIQQMDEYFSVMDVDNDGEISQKEFILFWYGSRVNWMSEAKVRSELELLDPNTSLLDVPVGVLRSLLKDQYQATAPIDSPGRVDEV